MSDDDNKEIINRVHSLIHNELKCVTAKFISYSFQISRSEACDILKTIPTYKSNDNKYEVFYIVSSSDKIQLKRNVISCNDDIDALLDDGAIYSISLSQNEVDEESNSNVLAAHENDMAYIRDHKNTIFQDIIPTILPNPEVLKSSSNKVTMGNSTTSQQSVKKKVLAKESKKPTTTESSSSKNNDKKVTTASSFFAKAPPKSKDNSKKEESEDKSKDKEPSNKLKFTKAPKKSKEAGNVDDFIGDMDESDEEMEQPKRKASTKSDTRKKQKKETSEIVEMEEEDNHKIRYDDEVGAMDSFVSHTSSKQPSSHKGKKKIMVDKEFVNKDGYIVSERVEEWVDVDYDEKKEVKKQSQKKSTAINKKHKVVNTKGLKQGSLTSFFKKK